MNSLIIMASAFVTVFFGGLIGLQLQRILPEACTTGGPRDMVGAVTGLVTLLLALVLGLLIWTAFGVYSTQKASIQTMAIGDLKLDAALKELGPEGAEGRQLLKAGIARTITQIWGGGYDGDFVMKNYQFALANVAERETFLNGIHPSTDKQKAAQAAAVQAANSIGQARVQMAVALVDPVSYPLLVIVVIWATCLFCGYGLLSKSHPMSYVALMVGALAIASAIEVIVDLSDPYQGFFLVSPGALTDVIKAIDATPS